MYTCGPTVYDFAHIGNFRAYIAADLLKRYLKYKGYKVKQIMNLTDVDDKTIKASQKSKIPLKTYTKKYIGAFFEDIKKLNIDPADKYPKATEHIKDMVSMIKILMKKKYAYKGKDGSIYYDISKFKNYGKLAHIKLKDLKASTRIKQDEYLKEQAHDFALWKTWSSEDGNVSWNTNIGKGRPGWHIECSAMSMKYLGPSFDIHTGGRDLIFPHHENEIAQSEAATGKKFVKYWFHNGWLLVNGKKMSKSLGNFYTLRDLLKKYNASAIRYVLLSKHYRQELNFTFNGLKAAENSISKLRDFVKRLEEIKNTKGNSASELITKVKKQFEAVMDDDLNISLALAAILRFVSDVNKLKLNKSNAAKVKKIILKFDNVLGLDLGKPKTILDKKIKELIKKRERARKKKDWKAADKIRTELKKKEIILEDTDRGTRWRKA